MVVVKWRTVAAHDEEAARAVTRYTEAQRGPAASGALEWAHWPARPSALLVLRPSRPDPRMPVPHSEGVLHTWFRQPP